MPRARSSDDDHVATRVREAVTFLFVPGHRPDRFEKAAAAGADLVVIDLEDAVPAEEKETARSNAADWIAAGNPCVVRVNAPESGLLRADLDALEGLHCALMIPKAEDPEELRRISAARGLTPAVIAQIETAQGVLNAAQIASVPGIRRLAVGTFDLAAELGVEPTDDEAMAATRGHLVLASAAAGLTGPVEGVTASVDDAPRVAAEAGYARRLGFAGKLCIHPRQLAAVRAAFAPTADQVAWAEKIVGAYSDDQGAALVDGQMIDQPVLDRARQILWRSTDRPTTEPGENP